MTQRGADPIVKLRTGDRKIKGNASCLVASGISTFLYHQIRRKGKVPDADNLIALATFGGHGLQGDSSTSEGRGGIVKKVEKKEKDKNAHQGATSGPCRNGGGSVTKRFINLDDK